MKPGALVRELGAPGVVAAMLLACGCSTITELQAGPVVSIAKNEDPTGGAAVAAQAGLGFSSGSATDTFGLEGALRAKVTKASQNLAFGEGFFIAGKYGGGVGLLHGGVHLAFERFDDKLLVGGGPYASIAGGFILNEREYYSPGIFGETRRERALITFGPTLEVDARFSRPSVLTFVGLAIGVAWVDEHVHAGRPEAPPAPSPPAKPLPPPDPLPLDSPTDPPPTAL